MYTGVKIPDRGLIYHGYGGQNKMGRGSISHG
jgi:hypothetical protein